MQQPDAEPEPEQQSVCWMSLINRWKIVSHRDQRSAVKYSTQRFIKTSVKGKRSDFSRVYCLVDWCWQLRSVRLDSGIGGI